MPQTKRREVHQYHCQRQDLSGKSPSPACWLPSHKKPFTWVREGDGQGNSLPLQPCLVDPGSKEIIIQRTDDTGTHTSKWPLPGVSYIQYVEQEGRKYQTLWHPIKEGLGKQFFPLQPALTGTSLGGREKNLAIPYSYCLTPKAGPEGCSGG